MMVRVPPSMSRSVPAGVAVLVIRPLAAETLRVASSVTAPKSLAANGASFTAVMPMLAVPWAELPPLLSEAVKWKAVLPFQLASVEVEGEAAAAGRQSRAGDDWPGHGGVEVKGAVGR